jgi:hypothetical protein
LIPDCIVNIDETRAEPGRKEVATGTHLSTLQGPIIEEFKHLTNCISLVVAAAANGTVIAILHIYKPANLDDMAKNSTRLILPRGTIWKRNILNNYVAVTKKGFMNRKLWIEFLRIVERDLSIYHPHMHKLIMYDAASSHNLPQAQTNGQNSIVHYLPIPALTTLFLQPLDGAPFARYKYEVTNSDSILNITGARGQQLKERLGYDIHGAINQAFTPETIRSGFRTTGIFPLDEQVIWANFDKLKRPLPEMTPYEQVMESEKARNVYETILQSRKRISYLSVEFRKPGHRVARWEDLFEAQPTIRRINPVDDDASIEMLTTVEADPSIATTTVRQAKARTSSYVTELSATSYARSLKSAGKSFCFHCTGRFSLNRSHYRCDSCSAFSLCYSCMNNENEIADHIEHCLGTPVVDPLIEVEKQ